MPGEIRSLPVAFLVTKNAPIGETHCMYAVVFLQGQCRYFPYTKSVLLDALSSGWKAAKTSFYFHVSLTMCKHGMRNLLPEPKLDYEQVFPSANHMCS